MTSLSRAIGALAATLALTLAGVATAAGAERTSPSVRLDTRTTMTRGADGVEHYHFVFGPVRISPGQNSIFLDPNGLDRNARPKKDGHILSFEPNLVYEDGSIPRVDVIHLHHAVWLVNGAPTWAAGEEKTVFRSPKGFGYPYKTTDAWTMNHMIHDLVPQPTTVYITYDMDFLPATAPGAEKIIPTRTEWMDVEGGKAYPVFDAIKGQGRGTASGRRFTYPDDAPDAYAGRRDPPNRWIVRRDQTLVSTAGHLHPGGLHTDLTITRDGRRKRLFRSEAKYWEPAGAVSWDVAMTATPSNWKVNVRPGDVVEVSGTYDTARASWYESMAIMPVQVAEGWHGVDPFEREITTTGRITHGPLAENRNHGGGPAPEYANALRLPDGRPSRNGLVKIAGFYYARGNMLGGDRVARPPTLRPGQTMTFRNDDAPTDLLGGVVGASGSKLPIYHTVTACRAPCNRATGIAYPLADGPEIFDSGQLGAGPQGITAAAQRATWSVPTDLDSGTYTYFCRVHPYMRGAFRVKD